MRDSSSRWLISGCKIPIGSSPFRTGSLQKQLIQPPIITTIIINPTPYPTPNELTNRITHQKEETKKKSKIEQKHFNNSKSMSSTLFQPRTNKNLNSQLAYRREKKINYPPKDIEYPFECLSPLFSIRKTKGATRKRRGEAKRGEERSVRALMLRTFGCCADWLPFFRGTPSDDNARWHEPKSKGVGAVRQTPAAYRRAPLFEVLVPKTHTHARGTPE